jgi:hypothetical protein
MSIIAALLALGKNTPIFPFLFDHIPTFDLFQAPARWNLLLVFSLALLAARGADRWSTPVGRGLYWTRLLTAGAGIIAFSSYLGLRLMPQIEPSFIRSFVFGGILLTISGFLTLFFPKDQLKLKIGVIGSFILVDLIIAGWGLNPSISPTVFEGNVLGAKGIISNQRLYMPSALEERLKFDETHRFDTFNPGVDWETIREMALPNTSLIDGVGSVNNFDPMLTDRYTTFFSALEELDLSKQNDLLAWMGVAYRIAADPDDPLDVIFEPLATTGRVHLVAEARFVTSAEEALDLLTSGDVDFYTQVILEGETQHQVRGEGTGQIIEVTEPSPNRISISVDTQDDGWLVLADSWYPGWRAYLDGSRTEIYRANYLFRAIALPGGRHSVEFRYQPPAFNIGSLITVTGLITVTFLGYKCYRRD